MKILLIFFIIAEFAFMSIYEFAPFVKKHNKQLAAKTVCAVTFVVIGFCAAMASGGYNTMYDVFITVGAVFGAVGDYTLKMDLKSRGFIVGVSSFLVGHMFYIAAFISSFIKLNGVHFLHFLLIIVISLFIVMLFIIAKVKLNINIGKGFIPLLFYCITIIIMLVSSAALSFSIANKAGKLCILLGATLFVVSDSVLALKTFKNEKVNINSSINTFTYFSAQVLIGLSIYFIN